MDVTPRIAIHIERLVIEAGHDLDAAQLAAALEAELGRLIATGGSTRHEPVATRVRSIETIVPATPAVPAGRAAGIALARSLHGKVWR
ncbi:MAG: hypothetical protein GC151_07765 [Betaproteobacteria bacterium]|nr:hypothetical protein [Betaproteobacteria bacterium]